MVDLRVAIGMELLATDQADGVHRTPLGGEQKRCSQTLWPELGVEIYLYIYIYNIYLFLFLHSYITLSSSLFSSVFLSAAILWYTHTRSPDLYTPFRSYLARSHLRSVRYRETLLPAKGQ